MSYTGRIEIRAVALEAIHHGASTEGNTVTMRRQEVLLPDGSIDTVPFVSGNSLRHMLRDAGVRYALEAMGVAEGTLSKAVVDLLFSGGSLGGKNALTLAKAKRVADLFPVLSMLGYSSGSRIVGGRLEVGNLHLVAEQNLFRRVDSTPADSPRWAIDGNAQTGEQFGTRHDAARIAHASAYLALPAQAAEQAAADAPKGRTKEKKPAESTQMIYNWETVLPGAEFFGTIVYRALKESELSALISALSRACDGRHTDGGYVYHVGAKRGTGHGKMSWHFTGLARPVEVQRYESSDVMLPALVDDQRASRLDGYRETLAKRRSEILAELEEIAA